MVNRVRHRSGSRCECSGQCGEDHDGGRCSAINGYPHPVTTSIVVLTVAHFHGEPLESVDIARMFDACQRCHNRYDAPMRQANAAKTRAAKKEAAAARVRDKAGAIAFDMECRR